MGLYEDATHVFRPNEALWVCVCVCVCGKGGGGSLGSLIEDKRSHRQICALVEGLCLR